MERDIPPNYTAEIQFLGRTIALKTSDNDPEIAAEVIDLVSSRLEAAEKRFSGMKVPHQVTLLALLDLAEEYVHARKRTLQYQTELQAQADEVLDRLNSLNAREVQEASLKPSPKSLAKKPQ